MTRYSPRIWLATNQLRNGILCWTRIYALNLTTMTRAPCRKNSCLKKESSKKWCDQIIDMFSQVVLVVKNHLMQYWCGHCSQMMLTYSFNWMATGFINTCAFFYSNSLHWEQLCPSLKRFLIHSLSYIAFIVGNMSWPWTHGGIIGHVLNLFLLRVQHQIKCEAPLNL